MLKWTTVQLSILPKTTFNVAEIINNVDISKNEILILLFGPKQVSSMTVATVKRKNFDMNDFQTETLLGYLLCGVFFLIGCTVHTRA